jgi:hypothetical protein
MEEFDDAVTKLLWPAKRDMYIKRTSQDCTLLPSLLPALPRLISLRLNSALAQFLKSKLPPNLADAALKEIAPVIEKSIGELVKSVKKEDLTALQTQIADLLETKFQGFAAQLQLPASLVEQLRDTLRQRLQQDMDMVQAVLRLDVGRIPANTPVNLYANLNISAFPYAVLNSIVYKPGTSAWAQAMLNLSDCPDLVEDHGHLYGTNLTDAQKQDLIAFLKTL